MKNLAFGKGKCTDLIKFDAEFEQLRIKLYRTSSMNVELNRRIAQDYLDAIERGNKNLRAEMYHFFGSTALKGQDPTLDQVKEAAQQASMKLRLLSSFNSDRPSQSSGSSYSSSFRNNRFISGGGKLNSMEGEGKEVPTESNDTWERLEGEVEQQSLSNVRAQNGGRNNDSSSRKAALHKERRGIKLEGAEETKLREANRCYDCYRPNHYWWKCRQPTEKLPKRKPTADELVKA
jgi:hypothetical protein